MKKQTPSTQNRRQFLHTSAAATAAVAGFMIVPRHVLGKGYVAPSDKLNIGADRLRGESAGQYQAGL